MPDLLARFTEIGPSLSPARISQFEDETGQPVPPPYRAFILRVNGGELPTTATIFRYRLDNGRLVEGALRALLGIDANHEFRDLRHCLQTYVAQSRIPKDLYPIGTDYAGNLILMGGIGPRLGRIYFWEHELEAPDGEPPTERNIYALADSLDEFLVSLKPLLVAVD